MAFAVHSKIKWGFLLSSIFLTFIWPANQLYAQQTHRIRVGIYVDSGAHPRPQIFNTFSRDNTVSPAVVNGDDIRNGCLRNFDVVFFPGGSGRKQAFSLAEGAGNVCQFVKNGGMYVGVCAGCYLASCIRPQYLGIMPITSADKEHWQRGKAILPIEFTKMGMEIFGVNRPMANVIYHNGPVMRILGGYENAVIPLCYYRNEVVARGGRRGVMVNSPAMVLYQYGNGMVLGISPHPEATQGLTQIELNAIHWLYDYKNRNKPAVSTSIAPVTTGQSSYSAKSTLSNRVYSQAEEIFENTASSHYQHLHEGAAAQVQYFNGRYQTTTDCSGFVSYVLRAVAPKHYENVCEMTRRKYPHAATYAKFFRDLNSHAASNGWLRISNYKDLQRGDLIAWESTNQSAEYRRKHGSGHVMIVVDPPGKVASENYYGRVFKYVPVYVLDSSSVEHFPPQSLPPLAGQNYRNGIGKGNIRLMLDARDNVVGFWEGTFSHEKDVPVKGPSYTDKIGFARLVSNLN